MNILTVSETSNLLKISDRKTITLLKAGQLPGVRIGARWRVDNDALTALIQGANGHATTGKPGRKR